MSWASFLACRFPITDPLICRLAVVACRQVLVRKQTAYREVIAWLEDEARELSGRRSLDREALVRAARAALPARRGR